MSTLAVLTLAAALAGAPAPSTVQAAPSTPQRATCLTTDSPLSAIAANGAARAVIDKDVPGLLTHPHFDMLKSMSLRQIAPMMAQSTIIKVKLNDAKLAEIQAHLAAAC